MNLTDYLIVGLTSINLMVSLVLFGKANTLIEKFDSLHDKIKILNEKSQEDDKQTNDVEIDLNNRLDQLQRMRFSPSLSLVRSKNLK